MNHFVREHLRQVADKAESPIEVLFGAALCALMAENDFPEFVFSAQHVFYVDTEHSVRIDFLVCVANPDCTVGRHVAVELDGHDFHERTKEQAARDKSRDRKLLARGCPVCRFTGSEVWNDPMRCARDVLLVLRSLEES